MEVGHDEETDADTDYAEEFDAVIRADTVGDVFGDLAVEDDAGAASGENNETDDECAKTKFHRYIITDFWYFISRDLKKSGE